MRIRIGISACLLGHKVRYDGGHKLDDLLTATFGGFVEWVPVCPEVESGLSVPREKMRLEGDYGAPRLTTIETSVDHTWGMTEWASGKMELLGDLNIRGFIFKNGSPSCGLYGVRVFSPNGVMFPDGTGIFAKHFIERFRELPVEDDKSLHATDVMDNFIKAIKGER